jgi:hypothetical protein
MNIQEIKEIILPFIDEPIVNFEIEKTVFDEVDGRKKFNKTIRKEVAAKYGVYVWVNKKTAEILYIGMAGRIKTDGSLGDHSIQNRLLASRGKDKISRKYIQTNDYVSEFMTQNGIDSLDIFIMYSKKDEPPAYIEALLLYKYYKKHNKLPRLNNSF